MNWKKLLKRTGYTILVLFVLLNILAAFHAYSFTKFYDTSEAKEKFNIDSAGFFDKAGAVLFGIKAYKKKIDSLPPFAYDTVILNTQDGISLEAWESKHACYDTISPYGTVIMFHGHGANKSAILHEAEAFYKMNYHVLLVDFRAHGNSSGNVCTIGYEESKDVKAAYDYVVKTKGDEIILWGISLGAAAEMKAVNDFELRPSAMILEMPFGSLLEAVKGRCRIMGVPQQPTAALLTFWGGAERGFYAFNHNPEEYAKKINCPVLLQWGEKDNRVTEKETETIFGNVPSSKKTLIRYASSGHQSLCINEQEKWMNSVGQFLRSLQLK